MHLAAQGHPIIGDSLYGVLDKHASRHALHAAALQIVHPITRQTVKLCAPLPEDMRLLAKRCGLSLVEVDEQDADRN